MKIQAVGRYSRKKYYTLCEEKTIPMNTKKTKKNKPKNIKPKDNNI